MKYIFFPLGKIWIIMTLLFNYTSAFASDNLRLPDVRSISTGGNGVTQTSFYNPSLIALSELNSIQLHYYNRYGLKELGTVNGCFIYSNNLLPVALHISSFGYDSYRQSMLRLSFGKRLNQYWTLGLAVHYSILQTELYEEEPSRISTDVGVTYSPIDKLLIGLLIINAPSISIKKEITEKECFGEYILQTGFQWEIINSLLIMGTIGTEKEHSVTGSLGIEYTAFDSFHIRGGAQLKPLLPSFGLGYDFSCFSLDVASVFHPVLGVSTGVGLCFTF